MNIIAETIISVKLDYYPKFESFVIWSQIKLISEFRFNLIHILITFNSMQALWPLLIPLLDHVNTLALFKKPVP